MTAPQPLLVVPLRKSTPAPTPVASITLAQVAAGDHLLIVGPSGSGKTHTARALIAARVGAHLVCDPHDSPGKWGETRTVGGGEQWDSIAQAIHEARTLMGTRYNQLAAGKDPSRLRPATLVIDEYRALLDKRPAVADDVTDILARGRAVKIRLIVIAHGDTAKALGLEGEYDLISCFAYRIYKGALALDRCPACAGPEHPTAIWDTKAQQWNVLIDETMQKGQLDIFGDEHEDHKPVKHTGRKMPGHKYDQRKIAPGGEYEYHYPKDASTHGSPKLVVPVRKPSPSRPSVPPEQPASQPTRIKFTTTKAGQQRAQRFNTVLNRWESTNVEDAKALIAMGRAHEEKPPAGLFDQEEAPPPAPAQPKPVPPAKKGLIQIIGEAHDQFIGLTTANGFSADEGEQILEAYKQHAAVKLNVQTAQYDFTGPTFGQADVMRNVLKGYQEEHGLEEPEPEQSQADGPPKYKRVGKDIAEWAGGMYRFYCTPAAWHLSPAARSGYVLEEDQETAPAPQQPTNDPLTNYPVDGNIKSADKRIKRKVKDTLSNTDPQRSNEVKRITKATREDVTLAIDLMCDSMQSWRDFHCDKKVITDGKYGAKVIFEYKHEDVDEEDDSPYVEEAYLFRDGDEFVCIPSMYVGEGTSFKGTQGNEYSVDEWNRLKLEQY